MLDAVHHIAVIASDYERSKHFYAQVLGLPIVREVFRAERGSWKCDLSVGTAQIELFSFPDPPPRPSRPEACGLRHLAFAVQNLEPVIAHLEAAGVAVEPIRLDPAYRPPLHLPGRPGRPAAGALRGGGKRGRQHGQLLTEMPFSLLREKVPGGRMRGLRRAWSCPHPALRATFSRRAGEGERLPVRSCAPGSARSSCAGVSAAFMARARASAV